MSAMLILSALFWLATISWVVGLLFIRRDWRLAFFGGLVVLLALHDMLTIPAMFQWFGTISSAEPDGLHLLLVSILGLLAVYAFDKMLRTERKRGYASANEQVVLRLREMSDALAAAQRLGRVGNWRWDVRSNRVISCSEEFARIHGISASEAPALLERDTKDYDRYAARVIHPDDHERVRDAFRRFDKDGSDYQIEYRVVWPDGTVRHVLEVGESIRDSNGRVVEQIGTVQDITDRKRAEEELLRYHEMLEQLVEERTAALRDSEQRLRSIFNSAAVGIGRCRFRDGRMLLANAKLAAMFGYGDVDEFMAEFVARERYAEAFDPKQMLEHFRGASGRPLECRWKRRDGSVMTLETHAIADDEAGTLDFIAIDISERHRIAESLSRHEAMVSALMEHSPVAISIKGVDGRYQFVNPGYCRYLDMPAAEVVGKRPDEVIDKDAATLLTAADQMVRSSGEALHKDDAFLVEFGTATVLVTKFPIKDVEGRITGIGSVGIDMTEHRRVEEALRQSEAYLRALIDATPSAINVKDLDGRYILVNPAFEQNLGLKRERILGRTAEEVGAMGIEHSMAVAAMDAEVLRTGAVATGEHQAHMSNNQHPYYALIKFPIRDPGGRMIGIGTMAADISEKKQADERLRESERRLLVAQHLAKMGSWELSIDGTLHWSDEVFNIFGIKPEEFDDTTRLFHESVHPDDRHLVQAASAATWHEGKPYDCVHRIVRPDGEVRTVHELADLEFDEHGNTIRANGTVQDITDKVEAEAKLAQAQKMEAVGQLTGGIAHDFNNLLAVIQGNAEMLAGVAAGSAAFTEPIIRATQRGAELTQRLLAFSRRQPLRPKAVHLHELVLGMSEMLTRTLGATIKVETVSSSDLWAALADPGQVENAVLNLAINARDAMPQGGRLVIKCSNVALDQRVTEGLAEIEPGEYVLLSVCDNGTGMSDEVLAHAFEPFFTTKEVGQGSGLGLSMVYGFARQSGGQATISSELGKGTTVKLYLPRAAKSEKALPAQEIPQPPMGNGEVILVVEDESAVRELAVRMLQSLNYRVVDVLDADAARKVLANGERIDLVLTDVVLPGGTSGPEFAEEARRMRPDLQIILMSGYPAEIVMCSGLDGPDLVLLKKPFRRQQVAEAIDRALRASVG